MAEGGDRSRYSHDDWDDCDLTTALMGLRITKENNNIGESKRRSDEKITGYGWRDRPTNASRLKQCSTYHSHDRSSDRFIQTRPAMQD